MRAISIVFLAGLLAASAEAQETSSLRAQQEAAREEWEKRDADYPLLAPAILSDVVQFKIEKGAIGVYTRLRPTSGVRRLPIAGMSGTSTVEVNGMGTEGLVAGASYTPRVFTFLHHDFDLPGCVESLITVQIMAVNLQLVQNMETETEERDVTLIQTNQLAPSDEPALKLIVAITPKSGDGPGVRIERTAPDFVTLRRLYRADTALYLEPIFRRLAAEGDVFGADDQVAMQIFLPDAKPDPKVTAQVKQLVAELDSDEVQVRDEASKKLEGLGEAAAVSLIHMDRANFSPEQSSRVDAFLSAYHPVSDEDARRLRNDRDFLLDCLASGDEFIVRSALAQLERNEGRQIPFDSRLRGQARRDAIAKMRAQLTLQRSGAGAATQPSTNGDLRVKRN